MQVNAGCATDMMTLASLTNALLEVGGTPETLGEGASTVVLPEAPFVVP